MRWIEVPIDKELQALFDKEARQFNVYPLDDRFSERGDNPNRPSVTRGRTSFTYAAGTTRIPEGSAPRSTGTRTALPPRSSCRRSAPRA